MRRKSERTSSRKSVSSPEKKIEKVKRTRTRRKKQSTSSENESPDEAAPVQEEVVVDSDKKLPSTPVKEESPEEAQDQVWRVKATESADSGEIQKLKICLTRPPSTPERAERSPRSKRKHSRATSSSDAASGEGVDEKKKSKHRSKRGHRDSKDESSERNQDSHDEDQETENEAQQSILVPDNEREVTQSDKEQSQTTESAISTTNQETPNTESGDSSQTSDENINTATKSECKSVADTTVASPKPETSATSPNHAPPTDDNEGSVADKQVNLVEKHDSSPEKHDSSTEKHDSSTEKHDSSTEKHDSTTEKLTDTQDNSTQKQDQTEKENDSNEKEVNPIEEQNNSKNMGELNNSDEKKHNEVNAQNVVMHNTSESHDESEIIELHPDDSKIETSDIEMSKFKEHDSMEQTKSDKDKQVKVSISKETSVCNDKEMGMDAKTKDNNDSGVVENQNDENELRKPLADSEHDKDTEKSEVHKQPLEIERQNSVDTGNIDATPTVREDISQNGQVPPIVVNRKRRWGSRPIKLTTQKSITISTDVLKEIIPDVKPVEFDEVIEDKKHRRVEVTEKIERPVLPKIVIDNTENVDQNRKKIEVEEKDKESIKPKEAHLSSNRKISIIKDNDILARPPSPPKHKQSSILYITNLVRPFTLPQLKNLLQRTGKIMENGFWIDRIKSKCFVQYESEDQAVETRHALHGVKWPVSNPKTLQVDFSSQDAFDKAKTNEDADNAKTSTIPGTVEDWLREQDQKRERGEIVNDKPWERKAAMREWDVGKNEKDKEREKIRREERPPEKRRQRSQERSPEPARKFKKKEEEAPAKLLDDLFRKTKTTPCIYWLPLSAETIAVKEEQRRQHMAEYERRLQEQRRPHRRH